MTTRICPNCGSKCALTERRCVHCGYIFSQSNGFNSLGSLPMSNVICSSCGSGDCSKLDDFTYRCNHCQSIIKLPRPDVNIYTINSYATGKYENTPVYQLVKNYDENTFVRDSFLALAEDPNISIGLLASFKANASMVKLRYLTFVEREYEAEVHYSCLVGNDYTVTYYENGQQRSRTETKWDPFSGSGSDGGLCYYCTFGEETYVDFNVDYISYRKNHKDKFEQFTEMTLFPLKTNIDASRNSSKRSELLFDLEYSLERRVPGSHCQSWNASGNCRFYEPTAFYYIPCYSLTLSLSGNQIEIVTIASTSQDGLEKLFKDNNARRLNAGYEMEPKENDAGKLFRKSSFGILSTIAIILLPIIAFVFLVAACFEKIANIKTSSITAPTILGVLFCIVGLIVLILTRKTTERNVHNGLIYEYRIKKIKACNRYLKANGFAELSKGEKKRILRQVENANPYYAVKNTLLISFVSFLLVQMIYSLIWTFSGDHSSYNDSITYASVSAVFIAMMIIIVIVTIVTHAKLTKKK